VILCTHDFPVCLIRNDKAIFQRPSRGSPIAVASGFIAGTAPVLDTAVRFADSDFLLECKISAIWRRFPLIFAVYIPNVRHISTSGLFDLLA